jgi:hypothetical protein
MHVASTEMHALFFLMRNKTVCMLIQPAVRKLREVSVFLNGRLLCYVNEYKYLGHLITCDLKDDNEIKAQIRLFYARGNSIIRDFKFASLAVKCHLFSVFCDVPYCAYLWCNFTVSVFNTAKRAFSQVFRKLTGFTHTVVQSNSLMFVNLFISTFDEVLRKKSFSFLSRLHLSNNPIVNAALTSSILSQSSLWKLWTKRIF